MRNQLFLYGFIILSIADIYAVYSNNFALELSVKPFLMPLLITHLFWNIWGAHINRLQIMVTIGLLFSTSGDYFMLYSREGIQDANQNFIYGLGSFLIGHLCYIIGFLFFNWQEGKARVHNRPYAITPFLLYLCAMLIVLIPKISDDMEIPVIVYSMVITLMAISALNLKNRVPIQAWRAIYFGALFFVLSDSIIALNRFISNQYEPYSGMVIMLTYLLGQYLIVQGAIQTRTPDQEVTVA